ncbi:MAG TPA: glycosyl hydrolase, partial [Clostridiales bacterium]|nr:glycosyl hydrolase [Clostridiales bacterium]
MNKKVKLGVIGLGCRGHGILDGTLLKMENVEITGVCDLYQDRADEGFRLVKQATGKSVLCSTDYKDIIASNDVEAVIVMTAWESHIEIAITAMKAGKPIGMEVGGAYSIEDCNNLIKAYEETGIHCMMLENCCYGRRELMVLNMARLG